MSRPEAVDISHYQGDVNMPLVKASLTPFSTQAGKVIAIKMTQNTDSVDPLGAANRVAAHAAGFDAVFLYHWLSPAPLLQRMTAAGRVANARAQAEFFVATVGHMTAGEGILLDAEEAGIYDDQAAAFCDWVEVLTGVPATMIYSGVYVANRTIWKSPKIQNGKRQWWLAAYVAENRARAAAGPGWCAAWQWTSAGSIPGIATRVDVSQIDDLPAILASVHPPDQPPTPPPAPWPPYDPANNEFGLWPVARNPRTLKKGMTGDDVKYLQDVILYKGGGRIASDGVFGPQTQGRVIDLQKMFKLKQTGVVDAATWGVVDLLALLKKP